MSNLKPHILSNLQRTFPRPLPCDPDFSYFSVPDHADTALYPSSHWGHNHYTVSPEIILDPSVWSEAPRLLPSFLLREIED